MTAKPSEDQESFEASTGKHLFELIEFSLIRHLPDGEKIKGIYGINVAKVREVVKLPKINRLAATLKGVEGVFELRGVPIPAINLCQILGDSPSAITPEHQIIVTEFSGKRAGFIVNSTHRIRRIPWSKVLPPSSDENSCISGMILLDDKEFLFILDLENIVTCIEEAGNPNSEFSRSSNIENSRVEYTSKMVQHTEGSKGNILLVEDSPLIRNKLSQYLIDAGFNVTIACDGEVALRFLKDNDVTLSAIITDLEMPRMDGYTLLFHIENEQKLSKVPIIIHSSLNEKVVKMSKLSIKKYTYIEKNDYDHLLQEVESLVV